MCVPHHSSCPTKRPAPVAINFHQHTTSKGINAIINKSQSRYSAHANNGNGDVATIAKTTQVYSNFTIASAATKVGINTTPVPDDNNVNEKKALDVNISDEIIKKSCEGIAMHGNVAEPTICNNISSSSSSSNAVVKELSAFQIMDIENEVPIHERNTRKRKPQAPGKTATFQDRHFVKHKYHDHANELPDEGYVSPEDSLEYSRYSNRNEKNPKGCSLPLMSFPFKLHKMLESVSKDGLESVISWQPHGRAFVIHKPKAFANIALACYFNKSKVTSFQRQLNLYGFLRISDGRDAGGYYHEFFLRHRVHLCEKMTRIKVKGTGYKGTSNPQDEPKFYAMRSVRPVLETKCHMTPSLPPFVSMVQPRPTPQLASVNVSPRQNMISPQHSSVLCEPDPALSLLCSSNNNRSLYSEEIIIAPPFPPRLLPISPIRSSTVVPTRSHDSSHPTVSEAQSSNVIEESFSTFNDDEDDTSVIDEIISLFSGARSKDGGSLPDSDLHLIDCLVDT